MALEDLEKFEALYYATALPLAICVETPLVQPRFRGQARCSSCGLVMLRYADVLGVT